MSKQPFNFGSENDIWEYLKHIISTSRIGSLFRTEQRESAVNQFETTEYAIKFSFWCERSIYSLEFSNSTFPEWFNNRIYWNSESFGFEPLKILNFAVYFIFILRLNLVVSENLFVESQHDVINDFSQVFINIFLQNGILHQFSPYEFIEICETFPHTCIFQVILRQDLAQYLWELQHLLNEPIKLFNMLATLTR